LAPGNSRTGRVPRSQGSIFIRQSLLRPADALSLEGDVLERTWPSRSIGFPFAGQVERSGGHLLRRGDVVRECLFWDLRNMVTSSLLCIRDMVGPPESRLGTESWLVNDNPDHRTRTPRTLGLASPHPAPRALLPRCVDWRMSRQERTPIASRKDRGESQGPIDGRGGPAIAGLSNSRTRWQAPAHGSTARTPSAIHRSQIIPYPAPVLPCPCADG
jgi:hypothetical protein